MTGAAEFDRIFGSEADRDTAADISAKTPVPATRSLSYVVAEIGPCENCGRDASQHYVDGICAPQSSQPADANTPRPCYRGVQVHAFVDLDDPMPKLGPVAVK